MAGLVLAFPYACMYRLRDQAGLERKELQSLLPSDLLAAYRSTPASQRSRPSISADPSFVQHSKAAEADRAIANLNAPPSASRFLPRSLPTGEPTNLPLSLIRAIQAYVTGWHETKLPSRDSPSEGSSVLDGVTFAAATNALKEFTDELTALERIRDSKSLQRFSLSDRLADSHARPSQLPSRSSSISSSKSSSSSTSPPSLYSSSARGASGASQRRLSQLLASLVSTARRRN